MINAVFLFVYGTLLEDGNKFAAYLKVNSRFYSHGKLKGKLYNIGEYPGAVITEGGNYIYGSILQLNNSEKTLSVLDDYEGFGDDQPQPNEFMRILAEVEADTVTLTCWVYVYNWPITGLPQITSGNYLY